MTPVCPACRAPVRLDSFACGRCGLAMRPTCGQCSEPLTAGMKSCWRCNTEINEPSLQQMSERPEPINVAAAAAAAAVENPMSPRAEVHRPEHFTPPEVPASLPVRESEASSFETAAFEHARTANVALGYIRELEQDEFDQENDRAATQSMAAAPEYITPYTSESYEPSWDRPRLRFRPGRVLFVGLLSGLLVAIGLLAAEGIWARYRYPDPSELSLTEQQFAQLDFSMEVPSAWDVEPAGDSVEFTEPGRPDDRGIRVTRLDDSLEEIRNGIERSNRSQLANYRRLSSSDEERVGGRSAILREFIGNDLQYRQWVVANGGNSSFEVRSWFHPAEADEAQILDQRIIESFSVL